MGVGLESKVSFHHPCSCRSCSQERRGGGLGGWKEAFHPCFLQLWLGQYVPRDSRLTRTGNPISGELGEGLLDVC